MPGPGRPFEKGQSGNPGGRPKQPHSVVEVAQQHCVEMIELLVEIAKDENYAINSRVKAAEIILDRGLGKPRQALDLGVPPGENLNLLVEFVGAPEPEEEPSSEPDDLETVRAKAAARRKK